jgi:hypothetical protein
MGNPVRFSVFSVHIIVASLSLFSDTVFIIARRFLATYNHTNITYYNFIYR